MERWHMGFIKNRAIKKQWKKFVKSEEFMDYSCFYKSIKNTAQSMMVNMVDFIFIEDVYTSFLELSELNSNISIMLSTSSYETFQLCKERVDYFMTKRTENWYI